MRAASAHGTLPLSDEARSTTAATPLMASTEPNLRPVDLIAPTAPETSSVADVDPGARRPRSRLAIDRIELVAIACGGSAGALARAGLGEALPTAQGHWPWATFAVNIAGALLLGWLITRLQERLPITTVPRPLLGTGLCGALTTFSTMNVEAVKMIQGGEGALAAGYLAASIAGGLLAVFIASALSRRVRRMR